MVMIESVHPSETLPFEESIHTSSIYLINTRAFLNQYSETLGNPVRLIDIPDNVWHDLSQKYNAIWFMGIYEESAMSHLSALNYQNQYMDALKDLTPSDVVASPFAIKSYEPNPSIASDWYEWDRFYHKLHDSFNLSIILDFVPNHVALDHPWTQTHPEYFINHLSHDVDHTPDGFFKVLSPDGDVHYFAHGKDPNYPPWFDTVQLNYQNPELQEAMIQELLSIVPHCDGVRCDMAMLLTDATFYRTWGHMVQGLWPGDFWPKAISRAQQLSTQLDKKFVFLAEAYWDKERLVEEGFNGLYQKDLYNLMLNNDVGNIKNTLRYIATTSYNHVVFLENHDEQRALATFGSDRLRAYMAILAFLPNSTLLIHQGQTEGMMIKVPMQVNRFPKEQPDITLQNFYNNLFHMRRNPVITYGEYSFYDIHQFEGDSIISQQYDLNDQIVSVHTNLSSSDAYAYVPMPKNVSNLSVLSFIDWTQLPEAAIAAINEQGLFIKLAPWETQVIEYKNR